MIETSLCSIFSEVYFACSNFAIDLNETSTLYVKLKVGYYWHIICQYVCWLIEISRNFKLIIRKGPFKGQIKNLNVFKFIEKYQIELCLR